MINARTICLRGKYQVWPSLLCLASSLVSARAQFTPAQPLSARSVSGQFVIHAGAARIPDWNVRNLLTNRNYIRLELSMLTISCERIKQLILRELGAQDNWRGQIHLVLAPTAAGGDPIPIVSERFRDGWEYRVRLPEVVERTRYVQAVTQVLLQEMANRNSDGRSAEIPLWLTTGIAHQLLASDDIRILLPPPGRGPGGINLVSTNLSIRREEPLAAAREWLALRPPLTFQELSWPTDEELLGDNAETYHYCAQLLVNELLHLDTGRACLRAMIADLPQHYNWQLTLLGAFHDYFRRPLDLEKWWALHLAQFTARNWTLAWNQDESWQALTDALRAPVQIRTATNALPSHNEVTLQTVLRDWDRATQTTVLQAKLRELEALRLRVAREMAGLVDAYHQVLQNFLQQRDKTGSAFFAVKKNFQRQNIDTAIKQLNALDARREALRPAPERRAGETQPKKATGSL
jgi:hypothetical protein